MDLKRDYPELVSRAIAGEEDQGRLAAVGRWLAEHDVSAADIARIHAAAVEHLVLAQPTDSRAMALLRASRVLAEVMQWRGAAGYLLRQKYAAESELRDLERTLPAAETRQAVAPFCHPLTEASAFLERVAVTDPLTGIYNARHFHIAIEAHVKSARESGSPLSLLLVDMDGLSRYNQTHGRREGDEALAALGRLLMDNTRASDFVARCGGDEFAVMMPGSTTRQALALAERVRRAVEQSGLPAGLTVSLGVATFPTDAASDRELVNVTHQACYLAQRLGGNTVCTALVAEAEGIPAASAP